MTEYEPRLKPLARNLRSRQTEAEQKLWSHLRRDQLGVRFYRQRPLGPYILDFYAPKAQLVVELDGSQHVDDPTQRRKDTQRDAWLDAQGIRVLRFDDRQALTETEAVLGVIFQAVRDGSAAGIPPNPPLQKGGEPRQTIAESPPTLGEIPPQSIAGSLPLAKGGQEGFDGASNPPRSTQ
ncbi:MAG: DUF559 domain-containing protein [Thiobacillus sp.]|nr:DUF559 domain-containing protein [Thiobacillus sp.]